MWPYQSTLCLAAYLRRDEPSGPRKISYKCFYTTVPRKRRGPPRALWHHPAVNFTSSAARGPMMGSPTADVFFLPPCLSLFDTWSGSWLPVWPAVGVEGILHAVERPVSRKRGPQHKSNPHGPGSLRQSSSHANGSPLLVKARFFVESRTTRWCLHQAESYETLSLLPHPFTIGLRARL